MYSKFMEKKVVNIWGSNFSSVALKKPRKANSSAIKASKESIDMASSPVSSKGDILEEKISSKKSIL